MMRRRNHLGMLCAVSAGLLGLIGALSCDLPQVLLPIETGFGFTNLSRTTYAALRIRPHDADGASDAPYFATDLLAPGATTRVRFLDALGEACPDALDFQILIYSRVNADMPIGLDDGEVVKDVPMAAGEVLNVPACGVQPLETYTIVNWDAADGEARVKFAQATAVESAIIASNMFPNSEAVWEVVGVESSLADTAPPQHAESVTIAGVVIDPDGAPWENVGVLIRSRFRVRASDNDESNDPDADFGAPIDVRFTDADGRFEFDRPAGAYRVEVFADGLLFRPVSVDVETPQSDLVFIAEEAS